MEQQQKVLYQYFQLSESLEETLERLERLRVYLAQQQGPEFQAPHWHSLLEEILLTVLDLAESDSLALMRDSLRPQEPRLRLVQAEERVEALEPLAKELVEVPLQGLE